MTADRREAACRGALRHILPAAGICLVLGLVGPGGCPNTGGVNDNTNDNGNRAACEMGSPNAAATVSYADDVRPILQQAGCLSAGCHGGTISSSGFDLRTYESSFEPGNEATELGLCPIVPGDPDRSYVVEKISGTPRRGARMPFLRPPLSDEQIATIVTWIREGAPNN